MKEDMWDTHANKILYSQYSCHIFSPVICKEGRLHTAQFPPPVFEFLLLNFAFRLPLLPLIHHLLNRLPRSADHPRVALRADFYHKDRYGAG